MALTDKEKAAYGLLGITSLYGAGKYGKRAVARGIDTLGFGNVPTSYASDPKWLQYLDNLIGASKGKRRRMLIEIARSMRKKGIPVELRAIQQSILDMERKMSTLRSMGRPVPKGLRLRYLDTLEMVSQRQDAAAIIQRSLNQPISHKHSGKFIEGGMPQKNKYIKQALQAKGLDVSKPLPEYNLSAPKGKKTTPFIKSVRSGQSNDPRMRKITQMLKENKISEAKAYAKTQKGVKIFKNTNGNIMVKLNPSYLKRAGDLEVWKEYRIGGHTQTTEFKKGRTSTGTGYGKLKTKGFDITTYASQGETVKSAKGLQKARVGLAGRTGQSLGLHTPVVTTFDYSHNKPGGGTKKGTVKSSYIPKKKKVRASSRTYGDKSLKSLLKKPKTGKTLLKIAAALFSRGRMRF
tara:strand:+ start:10658 stop:11875 length:1218 start_codon:yes stop_codon:yes gene_type:complete